MEIYSHNIELIIDASSINCPKRSARGENRKDDGTTTHNLGNSLKYPEVYSGKINISENINLFEAPIERKYSSQANFICPNLRRVWLNLDLQDIYVMHEFKQAGGHEDNEECCVRRRLHPLHFVGKVLFWLCVRGTGHSDNGVRVRVRKAGEAAFFQRS